MTRGILPKSLDYFGKFLLCWFVLETILYYVSGNFFIDLDDVSYLFSVDTLDALHVTLIIAVSGLLIVVAGPLLLEGKWAGIVLAVLYWAMGNRINPFWYIFPARWQGTDDYPTSFLSGIDITWSAIILFGIAGFFYVRRWEPMVEPQTEGHGNRGALAEERDDQSLRGE